MNSSPIPTGKIVTAEDGSYELILTRIFPGATADDVWASVTESERTARWYGPWKGEAGVGKTIEVQMSFEEGQPWMSMTITACEAPKQLYLTSVGDFGSWYMEIRIKETDSGAALDLIQHKLDPAMAGDVGPGWEYYLDMLVASRSARPLPSFGDYYPSQTAYFKEQVESRQNG